MSQSDKFEKILTEKLVALHRREPFPVHPEATVEEAVALMQNNKVDCVVVLEGERLVGIISEEDVVGKVMTGDSTLDSPVSEIMTANPHFQKPDDNLQSAITSMNHHNYRHLPIVTDENVVIGVLSVSDIVDYMVEYFPDEVLNLPPILHQENMTVEGG